VKTAETTIGYKRGTKKERWISDETWKAIDGRKSLKIKKQQCLNDNKDTYELDYVIAQFKSKDKQVKR